MLIIQARSISVLGKRSDARVPQCPTDRQKARGIAEQASTAWGTRVFSRNTSGEEDLKVSARAKKVEERGTTSTNLHLKIFLTLIQRFIEGSLITSSTKAI